MAARHGEASLPERWGVRFPCSCHNQTVIAGLDEERGMYFCIRDDDTSFFTSPEDLERVYGAVSRWGPISLAVVPFHRAGTSKAVPDKFRGRWSVHPLHENQALVDYLRTGIATGRF